MDQATQETQQTATETKQLSFMDEDISQSDYERLRAGEKVEVEVEKSEPASKDDVSEINNEEESETSSSEEEDGEEESESEEKDEDDSEDKEGLKAKKSNGFKKRIKKLTGKLSAKDQEIEYWKQEALKAKKPLEEAPEEITETREFVNEKPQADNYETHEEYVEALTDWKLEEKLAEKAAKDKGEAVKKEMQKKTNAHIERVESFKEKHDDFDDVIEQISDIPLSVTVREIILGSENGPELMYGLSKDREELERITKLPPLEAARAMGIFESRLIKPSENKTVVKTKTTKAPPPAKPISTTSANGKKSIMDENLSQAEYERLRNEQERKRASNY